ncbi:hypothetical protein [Aquabacterium sp.]
MMHILNEWLMFSSSTVREPSLWPLALAAIFASAMILNRHTGD